MELIDYITDLFVEFDEMGFAPTTMCPNPEAYAIEWRNKITKAFEELTEEKVCGFTAKELAEKCEELAKDVEWSAKRIIEADKKVAELTAENKSLKQSLDHEHASFMEIFGQYGEKCDKLTEENERLRGAVKQYEEERKYHFEMSRTRIAEAQADTVRKMHSEIKKRCIEGGIYPAFVASAIDQIAEEMLEGENESVDCSR